MFKKMCSLAILLIFTISSFLSAQIEYDIQDIGTLQTKASEAIAINNRGQILGWYNIDDTNAGKHFFVRDRDGTFHELSRNEKSTGWEITWRFLTDDGKAYGTFDGNANYSVLYVWDQFNDVVKLGNLPSKEIVTVNNLGQVLIKSIPETENGRQLRRPVIWQNGQITKLHGLEGDIGIESDESYGFDMNNKGEVVGNSIAYLSHKNDIYKQVRAVKWTNGQIIDLQKEALKKNISSAIAINDLGEVFLNGGYLLTLDGKLIGCAGDLTFLNRNHLYNHYCCFDKTNNMIVHISNINNKILNDLDSSWMTFKKIIHINDNGEIIAQGVTIYGESHAMLLTPVKSK